MEQLFHNAISLLQQLIRIPSFSREEEGTAACLQQWLETKGIAVERTGNNIIARSKSFDPCKPTLLLNSHHDTVKPAAGYSFDPFNPHLADGRLYGLGSNDAGAALVCLLQAFVYLHNTEPGCNLILAATAEEEISGKGGIASVLPLLGDIACAIVGEPTLLQMAVAERGLMVVDAEACGIAGHAARREGENAIDKALQDIAWLQGYRFERDSEWLGPVTAQVTVIETPNKQHNMVPDRCRFTIDIRLNEQYTHEEVLQTLQDGMQATLLPRSMRLRSSIIDAAHPLVCAGRQLGLTAYGSPTLSDKALMPFPALKLGPGDSARSHTADEYVYLEEIRNGIVTYVDLIRGYGAMV
ncbi:M20/M25/M40 family metallo-hydrolase [Taibaiella koreensis]|uniref:M20/M25/M40 family metallo-hydrolase n=1 Tax=Taibaiella koreensis TaxID=1268548 RepID=UPI000E599C17|nr:M20/M25/M40 family metallo-hydrolase [Taibaiella koreensis]